MNVNLNLYKYFYEVARLKNYTKASETLLVSQPSLSYSVKILEDQLGFKLFERNKNSFEITPEGQIVYDKLTEVFKLLSEIPSLTDGENKIIKVGVGSAYATYVLPNYIFEFNKIFPNLAIEYQIGTSSELISKLNKKEVDFIIDEYSYEGMNNQLIKTEETVFVASINNKIDKITFDNIGSYTALIQETNNFCKKIKDKYSFKYKNISKTPLLLLEVSNTDLIGISTRKLVKDYVNAGKIKILDTDIVLPNSEIYIVANKGFDIKNNEFSKFIIENNL